jgi:O-acetyl-ADP-ribose deacetylase (regulator of RNase III)/uncharacterized protein YwgA
VKQGNIFNSKCQTLVNTVNCVGVMGKGIALGFKERFPEMFDDYVARCNRGEVQLGKPYLYKRKTIPWIINFPTKNHWRSVSKLEDIVKGIQFINKNYKQWGVNSLAFPPLGSGLGKLNWDIVGPTLYHHLDLFDIPIELYVPKDSTFDQMRIEFFDDKSRSSLKRKQYNMEPGLIAVVEILHKLEQQPYRWPIGRTSFQKVAYFATELGLETDLNFVKSSYGPFAPNLKEKLTKLVNNGLIKENKLGRMFAVRVGPSFAKARSQYEEYLKENIEIIDKLVDLFQRIDRAKAEIAATIHYAASYLVESGDQIPTEQDVYNAVLKWKERRRPKLDELVIASTIRNLAALGWLEVLPSNELVVK